MFSSPFSPLLYLYRNKLKTLWIVIIVALTVVINSSILAIVASFNEDIKNATALYQKFHTVTYESTEDKNISLENLKNDLKANQNIDQVFETKNLTFKNKGIFGAVPIMISFLNTEDYQSYLVALSWELVEGRVPEKGSNELAFTENMMKNRNLKIGDKVGKSIDRSEYLLGEYQIVGVLKENGVRGGLGSLEYLDSLGGSGKSQTTNPFSTTLAVLAKDNKDSQAEDYLNSLSKKYPSLTIDTKTSINEDYKRDYESIGQISGVLTFIVIIVISLTMGLLNLIFIISRSYELGLMGGLHFSKWFIIKKILFERLLEILIGWVGGLTALLLVFFAINQWIYAPLGSVGLNPINLETLLVSLPVPISIFIFSAVGLYVYLVRLDPIEIIERNS